MNTVKCIIFNNIYELPLDKVYEYMKFFSLPTKEEFVKDLERTLEEDGVTDFDVQFLIDYINIDQFMPHIN